MDDSDVRQRIDSLIDQLSFEDQRDLLHHLEAKLASERREHTRKVYVVDIEYRTEGEEYRDITRDISAGGLSIDTREDRRNFRIGQELLVTIPDSQYSKQYTVRARIVRISDQEIGIKFIA
ncbi:MAG: PilZ domain-containing protein [Desulfobacterales bacterium]